MFKSINKIENNRTTILIVDDSKVNRFLLAELLDEYHILTAENGAVAIEIATTKHVDLILLDIVMPGLDGYEVCVKLKSSDTTKDIPVIFITGNSDEESVDRAYKVGGMDYVTKPFNAKELIARVKTQLSVYFMQKELEEKIDLIDKYVSFSTTDTDGIITEVSDAFCKLSGYSRYELIGKNHNLMRHSDMDTKLYTGLWNAITKGKNWTGEVKNRCKDGGYFWANVVITPRFDVIGNLYGYTSIRQDITNEKIVEGLSITDQLTDLYNRRYFNEVFPKEIKRAVRHGIYLSLVMLDVDFFKQYNDTYGHLAGDKVLTKIGKTLKTCLHRDEDFIFRLGGEEFGVLYSTNNCESSDLVAQEICDMIEELSIEHKSSAIAPVLTASVGLACIDFSKSSNVYFNVDHFYKLADKELYKAKAKGRNRISSIRL